MGTTKKVNTMETVASRVLALSSPSAVVMSARFIPDGLYDEARARIIPGKYDLEIETLARASMHVGRDYEQQIAEKAQPWRLLAVALQRIAELQHEADSRAAILPDIIERAAKWDKPDADYIVSGIKETVEAQLAAIKSTTMTVCRGHVRTETLNLDIRTLTAKYSELEP